MSVSDPLAGTELDLEVRSAGAAGGAVTSTLCAVIGSLLWMAAAD